MNWCVALAFDVLIYTSKLITNQIKWFDFVHAANVYVILMRILNTLFYCANFADYGLSCSCLLKDFYTGHVYMQLLGSLVLTFDLNHNVRYLG